MTPSLALWTSGEFVFTTIPGCTGQAHEATGFGARSTSTRHIRPIFSVSIHASMAWDEGVWVARTVSCNQKFS